MRRSLAVLAGVLVAWCAAPFSAAASSPVPWSDILTPATFVLDFNDDDLRHYFGKFGTLLRAEITLDKDTGVSKGFGFVSYADVASADAAMAAMNGAMVAGRQIRIEKTSEDGRPS